MTLLTPGEFLTTPLQALSILLSRLLFLFPLLRIPLLAIFLIHDGISLPHLPLELSFKLLLNLIITHSSPPRGPPPRPPLLDYYPPREGLLALLCGTLIIFACTTFLAECLILH